MALTQPDRDRQVGRKDVLGDATEPVYWTLQLRKNRDDAQGLLPKTYFVVTDIYNTSGTVNSPRVAAYVWGDEGDALKIETQWLLSDGFPRYLQPNQKLPVHIDTDGYTSLLLSSARHVEASTSPILHLVVEVSWTNSHDVTCVETNLPQYQEIDQKPWFQLEFRAARGFPAVSDWPSLNVQTETLPNAGWGPPALVRRQGDEQSSYNYYLNPAKQR
jgi:hypothetical protein